MAGNASWQVEFRRQEREALEARGADQPVVGGGGEPPHDSNMELLKARVDTLDKRMDRFEAKLDGIDTRLRGVEGELREIKGSLTTLTSSVVGKLPSWWQMPAVIGGTVALLLLLFAAVQHLHLLAGIG